MASSFGRLKTWFFLVVAATCRTVTSPSIPGSRCFLPTHCCRPLITLTQQPKTGRSNSTKSHDFRPGRLPNTGERRLTFLSLVFHRSAKRADPPATPMLANNKQSRPFFGSLEDWRIAFRHPPCLACSLSSQTHLTPCATVDRWTYTFAHTSGFGVSYTSRGGRIASCMRGPGNQCE